MIHVMGKNLPPPKGRNQPMHNPATDALQGLTVLERGWLSSNNVLLHGGQAGAVLVDSGHLLHAGQTVALVRQALAKAGGEPLAGIVNTHLHSDHCGGNASVQAALGGRITVPCGSWDAASLWDEDQLSYRYTGQRCARFVPSDTLSPGQELVAGARRWQVLAAPGHDPESVMLFDAAHGVLISADALWEHGFGVVFQELEGEHAFDDVARVLDLIESLDARCVVPGHGAPFTDVAGALHHARQRLHAFVADPQRHARHGIKVITKYHLMEERQQAWADYLAWFEATPLCHSVWQRLGRPEGSLAGLAERVVHDLVRGGALALKDDVLHDV
jgi:glyoxylase-like metal-dependent hydrolase (beta-lactamase superfamily II)